MDKYLKTYIRSRIIANESKHNLVLHELEYINNKELTHHNIKSLIYSTKSHDYEKLLNVVGMNIINFMNDKSIGFFNRSYGINHTIEIGTKTDILIRHIIDNKNLFNKLNHYGITGILQHIESEILYLDTINKILYSKYLHNEYNFIFFSYFLGSIEDLIDLGYITDNIDKYQNLVQYYKDKFNINEPPKLVERMNKILNI